MSTQSALHTHVLSSFSTPPVDKGSTNRTQEGWAPIALRGTNTTTPYVLVRLLRRKVVFIFSSTVRFFYLFLQPYRLLSYPMSASARFSPYALSFLGSHSTVTEK